MILWYSIVCVLKSGLTINFGSLDYDVDEDKGPITIAMRVRGTQRPFTLILTPTTIDDAFAVPGTNVADFVSDAYMNSRPEARATPGQGMIPWL